MAEYRYKVNGEKIDILNDNWDVLIILDACRYDYFVEATDIKAKKAISPSTCTPEFLFKVMSRRLDMDLVYVSGNAYINSKGVPLPKSSGYKFNAINHFKKIIDVWDKGWSKELGTVHPEEMNKYSIVSMQLRKDKRHIIHYVQPHEPYIYYGGGIGGAGYGAPNNTIKVKGKIARTMNKIFPNETVWKWAYRFGQLPERGKGMLWIKYGREGLIKAYKEDIKLVMDYVIKLKALFPNKKFLITADHGELLGEKKRYGHTNIRKRHQKLVEVPWIKF